MQNNQEVISRDNRMDIFQQKRLSIFDKVEGRDPQLLFFTFSSRTDLELSLHWLLKLWFAELNVGERMEERRNWKE